MTLRGRLSVAGVQKRTEAAAPIARRATERAAGPTSLFRVSLTVPLDPNHATLVPKLREEPGARSCSPAQFP